MKKNKIAARILQIVCMAVLFGTVLLAVWKNSLISQIGLEDVYWERARFLLGQGGATLYNGSSICSIGYSLILCLIGAVIKSPYAAYKAAILLNAVFLCAGYLVAVAASKKIFPEENESFLSVSCFFAVFCPVFAIDKFFTGPSVLVFFLVWVCIYLLAGLWEKSDRKKVILLSGCLILISFLDIACIGILLGVVILLGYYVKEKKLDETTFLTFLLTVLIGTAAGNIVERIVLYGFVSGKEITAQSSLEVLMSGIGSGWNNGYLTGLFRSLSGKCYSMMTGSFLLVCAGVWGLVKDLLKNRKKTAYGIESVSGGLLLLFIIQLIITALYDNSRSTNAGLISMTHMDAVIAPVLLAGFVQMKKTKNWWKELTVYLLLFCGVTFWTASTLQSQNVSSISRMNNAVTDIFQRNEINAVSAVYLAACVVILAAILFTACLKEKVTFRGRKPERLFRGAAVMAGFLLCLGTNLYTLKNTAVKWNATYMKGVSSIASILSETNTEGEYYFLRGYGSDNGSVILQSLLSNKSIQQINNSKKEQSVFFDGVKDEVKDIAVITGTDSSVIDEISEKLSGFRLLYMTESYALWSCQGSSLYGELENIISSRAEYIPLVAKEEEEIAEAAEEVSGELETETETAVSEEAPDGADEIEEAAAEDVAAAENADAVETESETEQVIQTETSVGAKTGVKIKSKTYGGKIKMAPGTYYLEVALHKTEDISGMDATLTVKDSDGRITSRVIDETVFDENGTGVAILEFTSRDVMRKVKVQLKGTLMNCVQVDTIYYRKLNSSYTYGMNNKNTISQACVAIRELDSLGGTVGRVSYVEGNLKDESDISVRSFMELMPGYDVSVIKAEEVSGSDSEFLIGATASHPYYEAMDNYTIIYRGKYLTVLVRNDSQQYENYQKSGQPYLSEGKRIKMEAFLGENSEPTKAISLEAGNYCYHAVISYDQNRTVNSGGTTEATVQICSGEDVIAEQKLSYTELEQAGGDGIEISVPFVLRVKSSALSCRIESSTELQIIPQSIELTSERYQFGSDEKQLQEFFDLINQMGENVSVMAVVSDDTLENNQCEYDYLQEMMMLSDINAVSYSNALSLTEDTMLLTRGFSTDYLNLLEKYSIIGHAGRYTLWARNNGNLLQRAIEAGASVLSSGRKISTSSIAAARGVEEEENVISYFPKGNYYITIELEAPKLEADDTIEVTLLRDRSESEIEEDVDELIDAGYTNKQARRKVERQEKCGGATLEAYQFDSYDSMVVAVKMNKNCEVDNLTFDVFTWHGCEIEGKMVWVETA